MSRINRLILAITLVLAILITAVQGVASHSIPLDQIADLQTAGDGRTLVARVVDQSIRIDLIDTTGKVLKNLSLSRNQDGALVSITDMCLDSEDHLLILKTLGDPKTGNPIRQEIDVYSLAHTFPKRVARRTFDAENPVHYRWISVSTSVVLMGTDSGEQTLTREAYELAGMVTNLVQDPIGVRTYIPAPKDGVYDAVTVGTNVAYTSRSGKLFLASDTGTPAREVYPARQITRVMYPIFLAQESNETVCIGEQESGDILSITLSDGTSAVRKSGTEPFSGVSSYAPVNVLRMSMSGQQNFSAVVKNPNSGFFDLVISHNGETTVVEQLSFGMIPLILTNLLHLIGWFACILLVLQLLRGFFHMITGSRTILLKLTFSTLPMLMLALVIFGFYACRTYGTSIRESFQKQVIDEGNMLTALFGIDSFNEIEYPYDYTGEAYSYLKQQMGTRSIHTATACYERNNLYIGADFDYPCFYPFDIRLNKAASELYLRAAYTGHAQTGVIMDAAGERFVCVTPIGGESGNTVYLLETSILTANMTQYTDSFLRGYLLVSVIFLIAIAVILTMVFMRILIPIGEIRQGLEEFARGNRSVRLENTASDEFSDIIRVFNKMANDIDAQIYSLRSASETYFRFIPQKMLTLLGKDNLGDVELGSNVERDSHALCVSLKFHDETLTAAQEQELTNRFFNIVNSVSERFGGMLINDSINLRRLRVLCPEGGNSAVDIALETLSGIDAVNATLPVRSRMEVLFVVHRAQIYYGICGDKERLIPALLSKELDALCAQEDTFRQISSRVIVTSAVYADVDHDRYASRFIGYPEQENGHLRLGLYDFYDASSAEETRLINETRVTFDKAMALYLEERYYDAKNLFALVLRQNQFDNVSRHYIFICEKKL